MPRYSRTRLGLELNFLIPSRSVDFFCLALSKRDGSSFKSGVVAFNLNASTLPAIVDSRSRLFSNVAGSRLNSSVCERDGVGPPSSGPLFIAVPQVTRDLNT